MAKSTDSKLKAEQPDEDEQLRKLQNERARLAEKIQANNGNSSKIAIELSTHADIITSKINAETNELKKYFSDTSNEIISSAHKIATYTTDSLDKAVKAIEFYFWILSIFFVSIGVTITYALYVYQPNYYIPFSIIWIPLSLITLWSVYDKNQEIRKCSPAVSAYASNVMDDLTAKTTSVPQPKPDFALLKRFTSVLSAASSEVASAAIDLMPVQEKIVDHQNKRIRRNQFLDGFRYTLGHYGFPIDDGAIYSALKPRLWLFDNEEAWLTSSIQQMKTFYPTIDESIFQLCYYDFFEKKQLLEPLWKGIKNDDKLLTQLALILIRNNVLCNGQQDEKSIPSLVKLMKRIDSFSLSEVQTRSAIFFDKLAEFKTTCLIHLGFYGLRIVTLQDALMEYVPKSSDPDEWRDESLLFIGTLTSKDSDIISLLVKDGIGDTGRVTAWKKIIQDNKLEALANVLAIERLHKQTFEFEDTAFVAHITRSLASLGDTFSVSEVEENVAQIERTILSTQKIVVSCAERYRIEKKDLSFAKSFIPSRRDAVASEFIKEAADKYSIDYALLSFLYTTMTSNTDEINESYQNLIKEDVKLLCDFLMNRNFVPKGDFAPNIEVLLKKQKSFELLGFMQQATFYEKISLSLNSLSGLLTLNGIRNDNQIDFQELINLCPVDSSRSFEEELVFLASHIIKSRFGQEELGTSKTKELATAATLLFLQLENNPAFRPLCESLYYMEFGSRVLYTHLFQAEERIGSQIATLKEAAEAVLSPIRKENQFMHFEHFQAQLIKRELPKTASSMLSVQLESIRQDFQKAQENGLEKNVLENYVIPISDMLNQKINETIVKDFLTTKVLTAYLITVPMNFPGMGFLSDAGETFIPESAKNLFESTGDETYLALLRVDKGTGKSTRIGIVPFGMTFNEFANKLERLLQTAVKLANNAPSSTHRYPDPLPYYLVRIFPSEDALQEIMHSDKVEKSPFGIIRDMVKDVTGTESISLLSLLERTGTSNVALKQVIESIIDHPESNLATLAKDIIDQLFTQFPNTKKLFEEGKVDKALFKIYNVDKLSLLCTTLTELMHSSSKEKVKSAFTENLIKVVPNMKNEIGENNLEILADNILKRMKGIGTALKL